MTQRLFLMSWAVLVVLLIGQRLSAQFPKNPIMFCTVVAQAADSATQCALVASHLGTYSASLRGGDLWIHYPNGVLKNLTKTAGYGSEGSQRTNAISVRQPSMHWSGKKAVFSMLVGGYFGYHDYHVEHWQIYEITGLEEQETPVIRAIDNQPLMNNNINPIYGTDDRILFISDRARVGTKTSYTYLDESQCMATTSGVWSLDPKSGDLFQLDHAPSGDYFISLDSFGRVVFSRWDILQHDQLHSLSGGSIESVDFPQEAHNGNPVEQESEALFPEHNPLLNFEKTKFNSVPGYFGRLELPDLTKSLTGTGGTLFDERLPSAFFPWTMNEDGTEQQTINHIGRHELRDTIPAGSFPSIDVRPYSLEASQHANKNSIINIVQMREDPREPGVFYAIDAATARTHSGGQLLRLRNLAPSHSSRSVEIDYLTPRATRNVSTLARSADGPHIGFYRNPLMTTDGYLIASYTVNSDDDAQIAIPSTLSNFHYRLVTLKDSWGSLVPDRYFSKGIRKDVRVANIESPYNFEYDCSGVLWEVDPVEVVARERPVRRTSRVADLEQQVFDEEHVSIDVFKSYLKKHNQALIVMRDVTQRDKDDKQQPHYLSVGNGAKESPDSKGRAIAVEDFSIFQADYLRAHKHLKGAMLEGRRVMPTPMHDVLNRRYSPDSLPRYAPSHNAHIESDGSAAAFVPAYRALSWQLSDAQGKGVVRERYWVSFAAGEVRTCARCHGENSEATSLSMPAPTNTSAALRGLLNVWKQDNYPSTVRLLKPANASMAVSFPLLFSWKKDIHALRYELQLSVRENSSYRVVFTTTVMAPDTSFVLHDLSNVGNASDFQWEVRAVGTWGQSELVLPFQFSTRSIINDVAETSPDQLSISPIPCTSTLRLRFALADASTASIVIRDCLGRIVSESGVQTQEQEVQRILNVENLADGLYSLEVQSTNAVLRRRFVVHH